MKTLRRKEAMIAIKRYRVTLFSVLLCLLLTLVWLTQAKRQEAAAQEATAEQSFYAPEKWAQQLTRTQGWGPEYPRMLADVNGDKRQDVVGFGDDGVWTATSNGSSFSPAFVLAGFGYNSSWRVAKHVRLLGDINRDGWDDIVGFGDAGVWTALSTGSGFAPAQFVLAAYGYNAGGWRVDKHPRLLADVNGDSQKDIVAFGDAGVWLSLATADGGFSAPAFVVAEFGVNQGWTLTNHVRTTADVNGDGWQDIVGFADDGVYVAFSTGDGFGPAHRVLDGFGYYAGSWRVERHPRLLVDMNGDRKQDIVGFGDDGVWIARSNGSGFEAPQFVLAEFGYNQGWRIGTHPRFVGDFNADGYQDIVGFANDAIYRALGGPGGFTSPRPVLRELVVERGFPWNNEPDILSDYFPRLAGDVNGDGMQDLVVFDHSDIKVVRSSNLPPPPPPAAPSNLRITGKTATSVDFAWNDNSRDERSFLINYGWTAETRPRAILGANVTTHFFDSLDSRRQYCFTVRAENIWGISAESLLKCARTDAAPTPTPTPTPTPSGFSQINVNNCHSERRTIYIWTYDYTLGVWEQRGSLAAQWSSSGTCPGSASPFVVPLADGHFFRFVAVDPGSSFCGGQNDPQVGGCQRAITDPVQGYAKGPALLRRVD
jgi:hypothetical protein